MIDRLGWLSAAVALQLSGNRRKQDSDETLHDDWDAVGIGEIAANAAIKGCVHENNSGKPTMPSQNTAGETIN